MELFRSPISPRSKYFNIIALLIENLSVDIISLVFKFSALRAEVFSLKFFQFSFYIANELP